MIRYVIVGTGVAAIAAAEAIRQTDASGEITIIGDDPHGYYSRPGLAYYLTNEIPARLLSAYPADSYDKLGAHFIRGRVARIRPNQHLVDIDGHASEGYDRLLLAVGASAVRLEIPGTELEGVLKLDHFEDAKRIAKQAGSSRAAVVVGGGITALELVEGLNARGASVHYLMRGDRYWGNVLDETESRIIEKRLRQEGVILHFNTLVVAALEKRALFGAARRLGAVRTMSGEIIPCDLLAYAIGVAPRTTLAKQAGIICDRGILANEYLQTNLADVYAAGDAAQIFDPASGAALVDSLWGPAREQGTAAGLNMSGRRVPYLRPIPFNVTRLAGLPTTIIGAVGTGNDLDVQGIVRGDSATWRQIPDAIVAQGGFEVNRLRLMVGEKVILGAIVMGDQKLSMALETLIRQRVDITPIHGRLLQPGARVADVLADFWEAWRMQHAS